MRYRRLFTIAFAVCAALMAGQPVFAADNDTDPTELSFEENINSPSIPSRKKEDVRSKIDQIRRNLERAGLKCTEQRQGEVLMVTIPCSTLFAPNSTELSAKSGETLGALRSLSSHAGRFKLIIAVHTDDTGDDIYADQITADRANAIDDFIAAQPGLSQMVVIPYGIGHDEPLTKNETMKARAANRRVELYIVPLESLYKK